MEKYATYTTYFCPEMGDYIRVPESGESRDKILDKIAKQQLTLIEVKDDGGHNDKVRIVQPGREF